MGARLAGMADDHEYSLLMCTTDSTEEAQVLAKALVEQHLVACVQTSEIASHFYWEGEATQVDEVLMLMKTRADKVAAIRTFIEANHSYDTPELVETPITSGLPKYLEWIDASVG